MGRRCGTCVFWLRATGQRVAEKRDARGMVVYTDTILNHGECQRNAPRIMDSMLHHGGWPLTEEDWGASCGEWKETWESPLRTANDNGPAPTHRRPAPPSPLPPQNETTTKGVRPPTEGEVAEANAQNERFRTLRNL